MTIEITRDTLRALRLDINAALVEIGKKHGVLVETGNASFTPTSATMKLVIALGSGAAEGVESAKEAKAAADLQKHAEAYGAKAEWLGKRFRQRESLFCVVGLLPSRSKNCILAKNVNSGKNYIFAPESVQLLLRTNAA